MIFRKYAIQQILRHGWKHGYSTVASAAPRYVHTSILASCPLRDAEIPEFHFEL
jgi:hypothetical protein